MIKQRQKVKVHIQSQTFDLFNVSFPPGSTLEQLFDVEGIGGPEEEENLPPLPPFSENEDDVLEYSSVGLLSDDGKTLKVSYEEGGLEGLEGCIASIQFSHDSPWLVTMTRSGNLSTALVFNGRDRRQLCTYDTGVLPPFELTICTRRISNSLSLEGGRLELEYAIEIRGVKSEMTRLSMEVTPARSSVLEEHKRLTTGMP